MAVMGRKPYPAEFRADATALYRSDPALTFAQVGRDLGVHPETVRQWVLSDGGEAVPSVASGAASAAETTPERVTRLEAQVEALRAENAGLRKDKETLAVEREILRRATKYFCAETNW